MDSKTLARIVTLLDHAKEELAQITVPPPRRNALRAVAHITEVQNILVGGEPTRPEEN